MASGKSAVARNLAKRLHWRLIDCDAEIVARAGKAIAEIFRTSGERHFRALERETIAALTDNSPRCVRCGNPLPAVVATGGGAIVDAENCANLRRAGVIICLSARPEVIAHRVGRSAKSRPMLTQGGKPLGDRIGELMAARRDAYARADATVDTSDLTVDQVALAVLDAFAEHSRVWAASR
ncbi:MAG TPA: shikimate kinase [Candidatus Binataceae bacterium]|nr:shikimate kinase [Candidatus Binataceae bacterium]